MKLQNLIHIAIGIVCVGLSPTAKALLPPPAPDGGYPGANTAEGTDALFSLTSGIANTAVGQNALHDNTTGGFNVAIGSSALANNNTGSFNMAVGTDALRDNNANFNLAIGFRVLFMNTTGNHLTGIGAAALRNNTTASDNTAIGADALRENTTGENNTAIGADALSSNITGSFNTANGVFALLNNATAGENTAIGFRALGANDTGNGNTAVGWDALGSNTTGNFNIAIGAAAGENITTANNVICIGTNLDGENVSDSCYIGSIFGQTSSGGTAVFINNSGKLGTTTSSRRFKEEIKRMDKASEAIHALKPVTFRYKKGIDPQGIPQFGLVAEDVEKVNPDLIVRDKGGKPYSVRYEAVNAMLLNEFLKEHRELQELKKQVTALTAGLQKVSARVEASKPAPQVVNNP
jgi:hypothetical protein